MHCLNIYSHQACSQTIKPVHAIAINNVYKPLISCKANIQEEIRASTVDDAKLMLQASEIAEYANSHKSNFVSAKNSFGSPLLTAKNSNTCSLSAKMSVESEYSVNRHTPDGHQLVAEPKDSGHSRLSQRSNATMDRIPRSIAQSARENEKISNISRPLGIPRSLDALHNPYGATAMLSLPDIKVPIIEDQLNLKEDKISNRYTKVKSNKKSRVSLPDIVEDTTVLKTVDLTQESLDSHNDEEQTNMNHSKEDSVLNPLNTIADVGSMDSLDGYLEILSQSPNFEEYLQFLQLRRLELKELCFTKPFVFSYFSNHYK